jgi:Zn finger protein HypA/HybF involved in hydrogenase expression
MSSDKSVTVRCVSCHVDYQTSLKAFRTRGCVCPKCGESKAQLREPEEHQ